MTTESLANLIPQLKEIERQARHEYRQAQERGIPRDQRAELANDFSQLLHNLDYARIALIRMEGRLNMIEKL